MNQKKIEPCSNPEACNAQGCINPLGRCEEAAEDGRDPDDSVLVCASDLQHSAIFDSHEEERDCMNAIAKRLKDIAAAPQVVADERAVKVLCEDDVQWITNDNAELGVKIGDQFFFLYKGGSLVYESGMHDDGTPIMYRQVFKREFGECAHPINHGDYSKIGTVSLSDSENWKAIPPSRAALQSAPVQVQEPFAYMISNKEGKAHFTDWCAAPGETELDAEIHALNYDLDDKPYQIVPVYLAPAQPMAVPDAKEIVKAIMEMKVDCTLDDFIGNHDTYDGYQDGFRTALNLAATVVESFLNITLHMAAPEEQRDTKELPEITWFGRFIDGKEGGLCVTFKRRPTDEEMECVRAAIAAKAAS